MKIWIDANKNLTTWKAIATAGNFSLYKGRADPGDVIIRWGANYGRYNYPAGVMILNPKLILSKAAQGRILMEHEIPIPTIFNTRAEWQQAGRPLVVCKPWHGQGGTGMRLTTAPIFGGKFVIQQYLEKQKEYRAMMVHDILAFFMEKHCPDNGNFRWNEHQGAVWTGVPENNRLRAKIKILGASALNALGYDFGAIDIILYNNILYVLEVNSRPEFGPRNAERFVRAIQEFLNRR
jgi:glutathione synthase/RimK-type ligase-like ATP-grasp enzyme